jgi:hypothetical protein
VRGIVAGLVIGLQPFLKFQAEFLNDGEVMCFLVSVARGDVAKKAFTFVLRQGFPPTIEMVVERFCRMGIIQVCFVWVDIGSH